MMNPQSLESARMRLEDILNNEIPASEEIRRIDIRWDFFKHAVEWEGLVDWQSRPISNEDFKKTEQDMKNNLQLVYIRTSEPYFMAVSH